MHGALNIIKIFIQSTHAKILKQIFYEIRRMCLEYFNTTSKINNEITNIILYLQFYTKVIIENQNFEQIALYF